MRNKIEQVKRAEAEADEAVGTARAGAARVLSEAEQSVRELLRESEADAEQEASSLIEKATSEAEAEASKIRASADTQCKTLEGTTKSRVEEAAGWVAQRLTS